MIEKQSGGSKSKFKKIWKWLLEKIETDQERLLRLARENIRQSNIHD